MGATQMWQEGLKVDVAFTSLLTRAQQTLEIALKITGQEDVPVNANWRLNERMYGGLTGLDKKQTVEKYVQTTLPTTPPPSRHHPLPHGTTYPHSVAHHITTHRHPRLPIPPTTRYGAEQVGEWRRSYSTPPPEIETTSEYWPGNDNKYAHIPEDEIPLSECLKVRVGWVRGLGTLRLSSCWLHAGSTRPHATSRNLTRPHSYHPGHGGAVPAILGGIDHACSQEAEDGARGGAR